MVAMAGLLQVALRTQMARLETLGMGQLRAAMLPTAALAARLRAMLLVEMAPHPGVVEAQQVCILAVLALLPNPGAAVAPALR
jgi:hypothetical protein